ncbi:hypothetical protein J6590_098837, partial [Homalodisca vitripennis]
MRTALCPPKPSVKPRSRSNKHNKTKKQTRKSNVQLPFPSILIEGDSHSRDLAALVRRRVSRETNVEGVCRPGAKLLEATSDDLPPPGGCSVIVAGTNDVASGEECNIYRHLERRITRKLGTSRVLVATLPHRHDLPASHRINRETALVHDFNRIGRAAFTSHGMHLKRTSKHLLAELLVKCLREMSYFAPRAPSLSAAAVAEPPSRPLEPPAQRPTASDPPVATLPFDSFADAVKSRLPMPQEITTTSNPETDNKKNDFILNTLKIKIEEELEIGNGDDSCTLILRMSFCVTPSSGLQWPGQAGYTGLSRLGSVHKYNLSRRTHNLSLTYLSETKSNLDDRGFLETLIH